MRVRYFKRDVLIIITLLYLFLNAINILESGFIRLFPTLVMLLSGVIAIPVIVRKESRNTLDRVILAYWIIVGMSAFIIGSYETSSVVTYLRATYWCSVFFIAKDLFGKDIVNSKLFDKSILYILAMMTVAFVLNNRVNTRADEFIGNNAVYFPLLVLPWIVSISKKGWKWVGIAVILFCVLISLKRSATLIIVGSLFVTFFFDFVYSKRKKTFSTFILALAVIGVGFLILYSNINSVNVVSQRFDSIEEDGGNGRDMIYYDVLYRFSQSSTIDKFIGHGYNMVRGESTMSVPVSAHNDFLEVLYDYGYVGIVVYVLLHLILIQRIILFTKRRFYLAPAYLVSYICMLVMSLVSHLMIYPTYIVFLVSFWAFCENQYRLKQ